MKKEYHQALIIDDDQDLCLLLKEMLRTHISNTSYVHTCEAGRGFVAEFKPDVIFLDNNLPDGQGVDMIAEIKSALSDTLLIIISATDMEGSIKQKALERGADMIIEKPLTHLNISKALEPR